MPKTTTQGTILRVESPTTPGTFVVVGRLTNLPAPQLTKEDIDVTDFDSTAMEFLAGLPDGGELGFSGNFDYTDPGQLIMLDDALDPASPTRDFQIDFTQQDLQFLFSGYVKTFAPQAGGVNQPYTFDGAIRVSGTPTHGAIV